MTQNPSAVLAPARQAYPKFAGLLDALASFIATDSTAPPSPPPTSQGPQPNITTVAGKPMFTDAGGSLFTIDFGDPAGRCNTLRGYNAAHVYDTAGSFTMTIHQDGQPDVTRTVNVLPDARQSITLSTTDDLVKTAALLKDNTILLLPPGVTFDMNTAALISANGISLRPAGPGPAPRLRRLVTPGSYSTVLVSGRDVTIEGIEFDSDHPLDSSGNKVGVYSVTAAGKNLLVRNCNFRNVDDAIHCMPTANGLMVLDCQFTNELRACAAYIDAMHNVAIFACTAVGSHNEHIVRSGGATNVLIEANDFANPTTKECVAIRAGKQVAITNNTLRTWLRVSEGATPVPTIFCQSILLAGNHFTGLRPAGCWMQINPGSSDVWIDSNRFDVDANQTSVCVQAPCDTIRLTTNQQCLTNGATTCKQFVTPVGPAVFSEVGTVVVGQGK